MHWQSTTTDRLQAAMVLAGGMAWSVFASSGSAAGQTRNPGEAPPCDLAAIDAEVSKLRSEQSAIGMRLLKEFHHDFEGAIAV
jgi:hypothetical protein